MIAGYNRKLLAAHQTKRATGNTDAGALLNISARKAEEQTQAEFVRDIFGNPFCPAGFAPAWQTETELGPAREFYALCDFTARPVLADALQDAGCDDEAVLARCRGAGTHSHRIVLASNRSPVW